MIISLDKYKNKGSGTGKFIVPDGTKFHVSTWETIPEGLDFSQVTNFATMFQGSGLKHGLYLDDWSNVNDCSFMYNMCNNLESVPDMNGTSNCISFNSMFQATPIVYSPNIDVSSAQNVAFMYNHCNNLQHIGEFNTANITELTGFQQFCTFCPNLTTIEGIDFSGIVDPSYWQITDGYNGPIMFHQNDSLTNITVNGSISFSWTNAYGFNALPNLSEDSIISILTAMNNCINPECAKKMNFRYEYDYGTDVSAINSLMVECSSKGWEIYGIGMKVPYVTIDSVSSEVEAGGTVEVAYSVTNDFDHFIALDKIILQVFDNYGYVKDFNLESATGTIFLSDSDLKEPVFHTNVIYGGSLIVGSEFSYTRLEQTTPEEPEEPEDVKPEISFTGLTLYPGVEYMMVGQTYDMPFETEYEPGTYEISNQQHSTEVDYTNKVLRITPTHSGFSEFCMYIYDGDIYEGERFIETRAEAKYKAQINIDSLQFPSDTVTVSYEISEEVENYWFEIDNCAVDTNQEEKCIYVTPEYNGVLADSNNVKICWNSDNGYTCYATLVELPPFTVPDDFPVIYNLDAFAQFNGDTVGLTIYYHIDESRPKPTIEVINGMNVFNINMPNEGESIETTLETNSLTDGNLEIRVSVKNYNTGNNLGVIYMLMSRTIYIEGWPNEDEEPNPVPTPDVDTTRWGNPDEATAVSWTEFEAAEPISINTETGEVSNAQWYELTGTLVCAPQMETGRWILSDPDGTFSQNLTDDSGNLREHSIFINRLENVPDFPGDGATITIKTLKHVATIEEAGLSWLQGEGNVIFAGEFNGSPAAIYVSGGYS